MDINTYKKLKTEFLKSFKEKALPTLRRYEDERKKLLFRVKIIGIPLNIAITSFLIFIVYSETQSNELDLRAVIAVFMSVFIYSMIKNFIKKRFENKIKKMIMPETCKCLNLSWSNGSYGCEELLKDTKLFGYSNRSYYDDIFRGKYKDVDLEIIESCFKEVRGSGKNKTVICKFKGVIIRLKMNKKFNSHTVIRPDEFFHSSPGSNLKRTTLEDPVFEKKFDVFANDEVEARYLITTSFMERLTNIQQIFKANKVSCAFYDGELFIGLHTEKDLFSLCSLDKPLEDYEQFSEFYEEIISIYKMIDYFKINEKIGL